MPFDLVVTFTGICAFVPDKPFDQFPDKVCVVLPNAYFDAYKNTPSAADSTELNRHRAMIRFPLLNVPGVAATQPPADVVWYLEKQRLTFVTTGGPTKLRVGSLSTVIDVGVVAPKFNAVDPRHLGWGVTDRGVCQVMFDRGDLNQVAALPEQWIFPNTLSGTIVPGMKISNAITLTMQGLTSLKLRARSLVDRSEELRDLTVPDGTTVAVEVAHLCDNNPLRWPWLNFARVEDPDFKWYFELLDKTTGSDYAQLEKALHNLKLPIPMPIPSPNGQGANCPPAKMAPAGFTLD